MSTERSTVVGVFEDRDDAERAVRELQQAGFRDDQIGFARRDGDTRSGATAVEGGESQAGEGAATGALTGGVIGGLIGAAAAGLIPGIGPILAGGILAATLGGAAVGAAAGGLLGALTGMGVPEDEARYYEGEFHSGRTLVTVKADGRYQEAASILRRYGAYDVESQGTRGTGGTTRTGDTGDDSGETAGVVGGSTVGGTIGGVAGAALGGPVGLAAGAAIGGTAGAMAGDKATSDNIDAIEGDERNRGRMTGDTATGRTRAGGTMDEGIDARRGTTDTGATTRRGAGDTDDERTIKLREEELRARKEKVQTGEVEVRTDVVEERKTIDVPVTREEVTVERRPTDRRPSDRPIGERGEVIDVPIREEEVSVEKRPVVYEELEIGKRQIQETETVSDTVRREVADVRTEGNVEAGAGSATRGRGWNDVSADYRRTWEQRPGRSGRWEDAEPGYRYSYEMKNDPRYQGRSWSEVESNLRSDYGGWSQRQGYGQSTWDKIKDSVRETWEDTKDTTRRR